MVQDGDSACQTTLPVELLLEVSQARRLLVLRWELRQDSDLGRRS
jgi:hypothetical protein